jgi:hypothetical protein
MAEAAAAEQDVKRALEEAVSKIARKASEGKRLSEGEVTVLMVSLMMRRLDLSEFTGCMLTV